MKKKCNHKWIFISKFSSWKSITVEDKVFAVFVCPYCEETKIIEVKI